MLRSGAVARELSSTRWWYEPLCNREVAISIWTDFIRLTGRRSAEPAPSGVGAPQAAIGAGAHAPLSGMHERLHSASPALALDRRSAQKSAVERVVERVVERPVERVARPPDADAAQAPLAGASDENARWQARVLDLLTDGVLLVDVEGRVAYRNAAAAALLGGDGAPMLHEARALALTALARGAQPQATPADAVCEFATEAVQYRLSAVLAPAALLGPGPPPVEAGSLVLVVIARSSSALSSPAALRRRFQLTAREASVALLLAEGRSNGSIARRLGISASTARHYTETVLLKLAIPTRAAVAAVLLGIYEHTDEHPLPRGDPRAPSPSRP